MVVVETTLILADVEAGAVIVAFLRFSGAGDASAARFCEDRGRNPWFDVL